MQNESRAETNDSVEEKLRERIRQLEAHVNQLQNVLTKSNSEIKKRVLKTHRVFDFSKYNTRHVALKIAYLGWDFMGFAVQEETAKTIEAVLFDALLKTRMIESRDTCCYHRCGRTDRGVSAFSQVISLDLRTNLSEGKGVKIREGNSADAKKTGNDASEIDYCHILNKVLPTEVRVLAWCPVDSDFSARFSCKQRTYKYYFPKGQLNIEAMGDAARRLEGHHDFRNFCKMDVANGVTNYMRNIVSTDLCILPNSSHCAEEYHMCQLTIVGNAFLWHQIRCIMAVLFLVGRQQESPEIVSQLLDIETNPRKPQYSLASELPLVLFDCSFEDVPWIYSQHCLRDSVRHFQQLWSENAIKTLMIEQMLTSLQQQQQSIDTPGDTEGACGTSQQTDWLLVENRTKVYKPLLQRQCCDSLEVRLASAAKRRKLTD